MKVDVTLYDIGYTRSDGQLTSLRHGKDMEVFTKAD